LNCRRDEHNLGKAINCYRCGALMGCTNCCERPREIICLACNNWASKRGVKIHGDIFPTQKVQHVRTDHGWRHWRENGENKPAEIVQMVRKQAIEKSVK